MTLGHVFNNINEFLIFLNMRLWTSKYLHLQKVIERPVTYIISEEWLNSRRKWMSEQTPFVLESTSCLLISDNLWQL